MNHFRLISVELLYYFLQLLMHFVSVNFFIFIMIEGYDINVVLKSQLFATPTKSQLSEILVNSFVSKGTN